MTSVFYGLVEEDLSKIKALGKPVTFNAGERVFSEGDEVDSLYFIRSGLVSLFIDKFNTKDEVRRATPGDWFGEMAMFDGNRRSANAVTLEETVFLSIPRTDFTGLMDAEPQIREKILKVVNSRNEELVLKEKLIDADGLRGQDMHIGIKGDPSLRESAMMRDRHESLVDKCLPELVARLEDLLLNRSAFRVMIGFNNGEIRVSTVLDPFSEEFHPVTRLLDDSYVERHFPKIDYDDKTAIIRRVYQGISGDPFFAKLSSHLSQGYNRYFSNWKSSSKADISQILSQLSLLRAIPSFYVRNVTVGIIKDAIHMQFNCDGSHIVSASGYQRFLSENL